MVVGIARKHAIHFYTSKLCMPMDIEEFEDAPEEDEEKTTSSILASDFIGTALSGTTARTLVRFEMIVDSQTAQGKVYEDADPLPAMKQASERSPKHSPSSAIPGPDGVPFLGILPQFARDPLAFTVKSAREYGPVVRWEFPTERSFLVTDPDVIEQILVRENQHYIKGHLFQRSLRPFLGQGLLTSEGEAWRRQRHRIEPAFHPERLERYATVVTDRTEETISRWRDGETRNVHEDMMALTLEIVAETLLGVDIRDQTPAVGRALGVITAHAERTRTDYIPQWVPTPLNRRFDRAKSTLDEIVYDIIDDRRANPGDDVVSTLLKARDEDGERMSIEQVHDEVMTLVLAGHETTALALTYTFFALAQRPDVEGDLHDELDSSLDGSVPTFDDLPALSHTENIVTESLRLYPPVYAILREPTRDVNLAGYPIPAGSTLTLSQYVVHRDPTLYEDPMAFRPDRWTAELEDDLPRFGYFPFGGGPRRCIGDRFALMEARLILATIARKYHLELISSPSIRFGAGITMRPKDPIKVRVHER